MAIVLDGTTGITNDGGYTGDGVVFADTTPANTLVTTTSGNVGIGTSSPATKFHVFGGNATVESNTSSDGNIRLKNTGAAYLIGMLGGAGSTALSFYDLNASTERARIDSSGNLLVGTTSDIAPNDGISLFTAGNGNAQAIIGHSTAAGSGQSYAVFLYNTTTIGAITQNGTTAVAYNTTSDYRLKENVQPLANALSRVAALKPCTYTWKSAPEEIGEGFIAHELQEVCPQAVTGEKDAVDKNGKAKYQSIDTSFLVATLTAAIQEQQAIITALTARVAALEGTQNV